MLTDPEELPKKVWTPEAIISDQKDARLLTLGLGVGVCGVSLFSVGDLLGWPPLMWVGTALAFVSIACQQTLAWRVARRLCPHNNDKFFASSFDDSAASLQLMRPSVIRRALRLSR